ncbi:MAG TPA: histone deacetylase [Anaerolineales bacterium]|nr:histone deacetylase [Anaerolineales bacterium]
MKTIFTFVPSKTHEFPDHPERPGRLDVLEPLLDSVDAERIKAVPAAPEQIALAHKPQLVKAIAEVCTRGPGIIDHAPTFITQTSYEDALLAAGGVVTCTRAVLNGETQNAFAIVRPPGHHAEPDRAMGFCIFNNIAIAARDALANGLQRVMVIDYDAHHGNGTQAVCVDDDRFGFISTHQWGIYPGTGWINDAPHAKGRLVNVPLHEFAGDGTFARVTDEVFKIIVESFRPQMLLISAGFDAHWNDPITSLGLSTRGYYEISKKLVALANEHCGGKIVFVLEGGYDPHNVANGAMAVFDALTNSPLNKDAGDPSPYPDSDHESRIHDILKWHGIAQ